LRNTERTVTARRGQASAVGRMFGEEDDRGETAGGRMEQSGSGGLDSSGRRRPEIERTAVGEQQRRRPKENSTSSVQADLRSEEKLKQL
jgi:hypothetical protein